MGATRRKCSQSGGNIRIITITEIYYIYADVFNKF